MADISDREFDRLILSAIEREREHAPSPPGWAAIVERARPTQRRPWLLLTSAAMIVVAVLTVALVTRPTSSTTDNPSSPAPEPTSPVGPTGPATTASPTTTSPADSTTVGPNAGLGFTPVLLDPVPDGFRLVWARYGAQGADVYAMARYAGPDGSPDIVLVTRNIAGFFDELTEQGRQTWDVDGRTVVSDGEGSGECLPDVCSVGTQWDDRTAISLTWDGRTVPLGGSNTQQALLELIPNLHQVDSGYTPGMPDPFSYGWFFPNSSADLVVAGPVAGNPAVIVDNGQTWAQRLDTVAQTAFSTGDGRVVIDSAEGPKLLDSTGLHDLWGNVSWTTAVRIQDVATIGGVPTALITQPDGGRCATDAGCPVSIRLSPLDRYDPQTVASNVAGVDVSTRLSLTNDGTIAGFRAIDGSARLFTFSPNGINVAQQADASARLLAVDPSASIAAWTERNQLVVQDITSGQITRNPLPLDLQTEAIAGIDLVVDLDGTALVALSTARGDIVVVGPNNEAHLMGPDLKGSATLTTRPSSAPD